ncbi:MAG TPA: hypothetical protein DCS20_03700 [Candidatus Yonathbacteria bacterium]|nr:hypothetical protein [Candidatus Yonathbacteria bacterium]
MEATKLNWRIWSVVVIAIVFMVGAFMGWGTEPVDVQPITKDDAWSYTAEGQEGGSVLVLIKNSAGKQLCSGWEAPQDALYTNLDPHRIADILIEKKCKLTPDQQLSDEVTVGYTFTHVDIGYIVATSDTEQNPSRIIFITTDKGSLYDAEPLGSTKYTVKELWTIPKGAIFLGTSNDWWNFLTKSCIYPEGDLRPFSDICSYSIYDRHGKVTAKDFYTEKDVTSLTASWYDPMHHGFLLVFVAETPEQRRQFTYIFLSLVNNPRSQITELATFTDQDAPSGKGCGFDFSSNTDSITIGGGCINPVGQPYPLVLPFSHQVYPT